jgi:hypothetical protein
VVAVSAPALAIAFTLAAVHTPGYSNWRDTVSRLGSPGQSWAAFTRASFVGYGVVVLVASGPLRDALRLPAAFGGLVRIYGVCAVIAGLAPKDMPGAPHTWMSSMHVASTIIGGCSIVGAMVLIFVADLPRPMRRLTFIAALATIAAAITLRFTWGSDFYGATERVLLLAAVGWLSAAGRFAMLGHQLGDQLPAEAQRLAPRDGCYSATVVNDTRRWSES